MRNLIVAAVLALAGAAGCGSHEPSTPQPHLEPESFTHRQCCSVPDCQCGDCRDSGPCPCAPEYSKQRNPDPHPSEPGGPAPGGISPN